MPIKVYIHERVLAYQRALPPGSRRAAKAALRALPEGDTIPLRDELDGFQRLRVGEHRFIWNYRQPGVHVFYAAPRATVYEYLAAHLKELLD